MEALAKSSKSMLSDQVSALGNEEPRALRIGVRDAWIAAPLALESQIIL